MQVVVKKSVLEQMLNQLVEERSFHSRRYDQIAGDDKPVLPDAQVASQLSASTVPLGDPDFLPVNKQQLSSAASQMAQQVSPDKIQKFYSGLKKLIRKTGEKKQYKGMSDTDLMEEVRRAVKSILAESEDEEEDPFSGDANREISNLTGYKEKSPGVKRNVGRTSVGPKGDDFNPQSRDAVKDLLRTAGEGGETAVSAANTRQLMGIRAGQGYAFEKTPPESDDSPATSVFDVNRRPRRRPITIEDHLIGVVNNVLDSIKKKSLEKDASAPVVYPRNVAAGAIEIDIKEGEYKKERRLDKERADKLTDITITISSKKPDLMKPAVISIVGDKEAGTPFATSTGAPYTWDQYKKAFSKLYAEQAFIRNNYPSSKKDDQKFDDMPDDADNDIGTESDGNARPSLDTLDNKDRNLGGDFAAMLGSRTGKGSPGDVLDPRKVVMNNSINQLMYSTFIYSPVRTAARGKGIFKGINELFPESFSEFCKKNPDAIEAVNDLFDSFIKLYLKSSNFENDFFEFKELRDTSPNEFQHVKSITATEHRLGIRDTNSVFRFVLGFNLVSEEVRGRCIDYVKKLIEGDTPDDEYLSSKLEKQLSSELTTKGRNKNTLKSGTGSVEEGIEYLTGIDGYLQRYFQPGTENDSPNSVLYMSLAGFFDDIKSNPAVTKKITKFITTLSSLK
jgi:hypothetical protein